jgi:virulence-associated protein VapD
MRVGVDNMYAISFDLDIEMLKKTYGESFNNAYADIRKYLELHDFKWIQGSMYFGDLEKVDAVTCVLTVQDFAKSNEWFKQSVRDIRMLRIEDNNNLMPAIDRA